jgi:hypothetical protein
MSACCRFIAQLPSPEKATSSIDLGMTRFVSADFHLRVFRGSDKKIDRFLNSFVTQILRHLAAA